MEGFVGSTRISVKLLPAENVDVASNCQVAPPSVDLRSAPAPGSPIPEYTISGLPGANATAPVVSDGVASVLGAHVAPASYVSHSPPSGADASQWLAFPGSPARCSMRLLYCSPNPPNCCGAGPLLSH